MQEKGCKKVRTCTHLNRLGQKHLTFDDGLRDIEIHRIPATRDVLGVSGTGMLFLGA